jgi:RNA polymerase sigma factor (sigma-70 family)
MPGQDPYGDIESLIRALHDELGRVAFRYLGHYDDAKEAVQEGCIKASRYWPKIAGFATAGRQRAYLVRIVINEALQIRRRAHRKRELLAADRPQPSETGPGWIPELPGGHGYDAKERLRCVWQGISQLPDGTREVVALYAAGYENKEISEMLVIADSTVRSHISLGRKRLRQLCPPDREEGLK